MALNNVNFVLGQGGLGRPLPGQDYISGLLFYSASLPSGFSTSNRIKKFFSVADAVAAGIKSDYSDESKATATFTSTVIGTNGDTVAVSVAEPNSVSVALGTYIKASGDSSTTLVAAGIAAAINANTVIRADGTPGHGYKATAALAVVTITATPRPWSLLKHRHTLNSSLLNRCNPRRYDRAIYGRRSFFIRCMELPYRRIFQAQTTRANLCRHLSNTNTIHIFGNYHNAKFCKWYYSPNRSFQRPRQRICQR